MINRLKHSILPWLALATAALVLPWSGSANAQTFGPPCAITPISIGIYTTYNSGPASTAPVALCASEATLAGITNYLQTGQAQGIAGRAMQSSGMSGGVVDQLAIANTQESISRKQGQQDLANEDVRNRALAVEEDMTSAIYRSTMPVSSRACHSAAGTSASGGAVGGGGAAGRYQQVKKKQEESMLTPGTENDYVADMINMPGVAESCTAADARNKIPGCEAGAGSMPGVNLSPFILVRSYTGQATDKSSYSIPNNESDRFYQAQQGYMTYSRPRPGPTVRDSAKSQPITRAYLVLQRRYNSRALVVVNTMSHIASQTLAIDPNSPFIENVWNQANVQGGKSLKEDFQAIYADTPAPPIPSEREIMNLLVLRQFTADQSGKDLAADPLDIARRRLDVKKVNALLLLKMNENAEWNNILYAHILSNRLDPVSRSQLLNAATNAN